MHQQQRRVEDAAPSLGNNQNQASTILGELLRIQQQQMHLHSLDGTYALQTLLRMRQHDLLMQLLPLLSANTSAKQPGDDIYDVIDLTGDDTESTNTAVAVPDADHNHASEDGNVPDAHSRKRRPSRCRNCDQKGHNIRTCPSRDPGAHAAAPTGVARTVGRVELNPIEGVRRGATINASSMEMEERKGHSSGDQARSAAEPAFPPQSTTIWRPCLPKRFKIRTISQTPRPDPSIPTDPRKRRLRVISEQEANVPKRLDHVEREEGHKNVRPQDPPSKKPRFGVLDAETQPQLAPKLTLHRCHVCKISYTSADELKSHGESVEHKKEYAAMDMRLAKSKQSYAQERQKQVDRPMVVDLERQHKEARQK